MLCVVMEVCRRNAVSIKEGLALWPEERNKYLNYGEGCRLEVMKKINSRCIY